jgi:gas vesicle protein
MSNHNGVGPGGVIAAFLVGALAGAAAALLYAPATGEDARDYLGQRAREGRDRANEAAQHGREVLQRQRDNLSTTFEKVREAYQTARDEREQDA